MRARAGSGLAGRASHRKKPVASSLRRDATFASRGGHSFLMLASSGGRSSLVVVRGRFDIRGCLIS